MNIRLSVPAITQQYRFIMSPGAKLIFVVWSISIASLSGIPQLTANAQTPVIHKAQVAILPERLVTNADTEQSVRSAIPQLQVIAIEAKKATPTPARMPTKVPEKKSTGNDTTTKTATTSQSVASAASPSSSSQGILEALNVYRQKNGKSSLAWDGKLGAYAQSRAAAFSQRGDLDGHAGFQDYIRNQNGFDTLGFWKLGENSSSGHTVGPTELIETVYGNSSAHNESQLSSDWTHVGIGVEGLYTDLVFGGHKQ